MLKLKKAKYCLRHRAKSRTNVRITEFKMYERTYHIHDGHIEVNESMKTIGNKALPKK